MTTTPLPRRSMIIASMAALAATSCTSLPLKSKPKLKLSLAQFSLHRGFRGKNGYKKIDSLDFPKIT